MNDYIDQLLYDVLDQELSEFAYSSEVNKNEITGEAIITAIDSGTLSGVAIAVRLFEIVDDTLFIKVINADGTVVEKGDMIMIIGGLLSSIDRVKPIVLTFLKRMSAIASNTSKLVKLLSGTEIKVFDSLSHTPLFHPFEQLAITHGGGTIFEQMFPNLTIVNALFITQDMSDLWSDSNHHYPVDYFDKYVVEINNLPEFKRVLDSKYDMILLRDMTIRDIMYCLELQSTKKIILGGPYTISDVQSITATSLYGIRYVHSNEYKQVMDIQLTMNR